MNETLGDRIAALRKQKGLTQAQLAQQLHVTDKAVSKWERNLSCPDIATLPQLAAALEVSTEALLEGSKAHTAPRQAPDILHLILRAVALAMGVAVAVLSGLGKLDARTGMGLLGIGLAALALDRLQEKG